MPRAELVEATKLLVNAFGLDATQLVIRKHWHELASQEALRLLVCQLPHHKEYSPEYRVFDARLHALEQCCSRGIEKTFEGYNEAVQSILSLVNADTWDCVRSVVEANLHNLLPEVAL